MFLHNVSASDSRFKQFGLHEGLNIIVADRSEASEPGDSRNGTGKSSAVRIIRYLLGGDRSGVLKSEALQEHTFAAELEWSALGNNVVRVSRPTSPSTRVELSTSNRNVDLHVSEWREMLGATFFHLPEGTWRPTVGQLWGQLLRTYFEDPIKTHASESKWESGVRIGYFLGLAPEALSKAGQVAKLTNQRKALREAIREGAIPHIRLDEAELRSNLASARRKQELLARNLQGFRVDEQYAVHQERADSLSAQIQSLNEEALALERRSRQLRETVELDVVSGAEAGLADRLTAVYREVAVSLPDSVKKRFHEVAAFHESVIKNRRTFLTSEIAEVDRRLREIEHERSHRDHQRASTMQLLRDNVALDTFLHAQQALNEVAAEVADLERRLESATSISDIDTSLRILTVEAEATLREEMTDRADRLEQSVAMFDELGAEIYSDRTARLLISATAKGLLNVEPYIEADESEGIRGVATYLLDTVCLISALGIRRAPPLLVHDSHLFDSTDSRQIAACLRQGARLAEKFGYQYIVTMNSDTLASVKREGEFDWEEYAIDLNLNDATEEGGLFGFRFG